MLSSDYKFHISYAFCVSRFLQNKLTSNERKYKIMNEIFYGE